MFYFCGDKISSRFNNVKENVRASEQEQVSSVCWHTVFKNVTCAPLSEALTNTWGTGNIFADCAPAETELL